MHWRVERLTGNRATLFRGKKFSEIGIKRSSSLLLLAIFLLLFFFSPRGWARPSLSQGLEDLGYNRDIRVEGASGGFSAFFLLPRMRELSGEMIWEITPSPLIRENGIFTFYVDDELILTRTAGDLRKDSRVRVPLSGDLSPGRFLHVRVESRINITEDLCRDLFTGQLFFSVHKESSLLFQDLRMPPHTVSDFFETLFGFLHIVLPEKPSLEESRAAIWLEALLRKAVPGLSVSVVSELPEEDEAAFVLIAEKADSLPEDISPKKGISLMGERGLLVFANGEPGVLGDMIRGLSCFAVFGAIPSSSILPERLQDFVNPPSTNLLKLVEGTGHDTVLLELPVFPGLLPAVPETLSFELEGAFTAPYDVSRPSRIDIYWNDVFLESDHLPGDGFFRKKVLLPSGISMVTENWLRLMISYYKDEGLCRYRSPENRATLFPSSTFKGHGTYPLNKLSWNSFGLFALSEGLFLLDEDLSIEVVRSAGNMLFWLSSRYPEGVFLFPEIRTTRVDVADLENAPWLLAVSSPGKIPETLRNLLPLDVRGDFLLRTHRQGTFRYSYDQEEELALFLLGSSSKPVLLLSSSHPHMMASAADFFTSPQNAGSLSGNLLAFRSSRDVRAFDTRESFVTVERGLIRPLLERLWFRYRNALILSLWVLVTLLFGMFLLKKRRKT